MPWKWQRNIKMNERENAIYWWSKVPSLLSMSNDTNKREFTDKYFNSNRIVSNLTSNEIESIWIAEGKPNKLYSQSEMDEAIRNARKDKVKL